MSFKVECERRRWNEAFHNNTHWEWYVRISHSATHCTRTNATTPIIIIVQKRRATVFLCSAKMAFVCPLGDQQQSGSSTEWDMNGPRTENVPGRRSIFRARSRKMYGAINKFDNICNIVTTQQLSTIVIIAHSRTQTAAHILLLEF